MMLAASGHEVETTPDVFGELEDSSSIVGDLAALRERFRADGYVFLRGLLPSDVVLSARHEILTKYAIVGEVDDRHPVMDAVPGDRHGVFDTNMRAFTESVRTGHHYESVILHERLLSVIGGLLEGEAVPFTMRWPRLVRPGEGCGFHCDGPYMNRGTDRHLSCWTPLGHIEPANSGLMVLEGSHTNPDLRAGYLSMDADRDGLVWLDEDPTVVRQRYGRRWLTTTYEPGDVLIFTMDTLHGAFDNAMSDRCRLSTDSRYYVAGEVPDPRWNGDDINPHGPGRVFYPGLGSWANEDFQDEWKYVDDQGRIVLSESGESNA